MGDSFMFPDYGEPDPSDPDFWMWVLIIFFCLCLLGFIL